MPRSISTPFAMEVSGDIGGIPDLTAVFVVMTGVLGAALGEVIVKYLPLRSSLARGALFGMGAHGAGVARAHQMGREEGSIAGLVMVMVGIVNVIIVGSFASIIIVGSFASMLSAWGLATLMQLDPTLRLSLMPRSISTPFAMEVSGDIGGIPDLTAIFVVLTGVMGAALGEVIVKYLPLRSSLARGALFGMGAHGAGVARAHQMGRQEGSIAGLVMVMVGIVNVLLAPILGWLLK